MSAADPGWIGLLFAAPGLPPVELAFAMASVLAAYVVLGLTGFGSALVAVPLLAWWWPLTLVVPLILLIEVPSMLLHTWLNRREVAWREVPPLVPSVVVGAVLGVWLAQRLPVRGLLAALGAYVLVVAWRGWRGVKPPPPAPPSRAWFAGLAIGIVESLYGTAGPVVMAWLQRRLHDMRGLRATAPAVFLLMGLSALGAAGWAGTLWQAALWPLLLPLGASAMAGVALGHRLSARVPAARMVRMTYALLAASGGSMLWRAAAMGG